MTEPLVHVVPCVDTEGPFYESPAASLERVRDLTGVSLDDGPGIFEKLRRGAIDLNGMEDIVARMLDERLLSYNDSWEKLSTMLMDTLGKHFREKYLDSFGNGVVYNWFVVDHMNVYESNPRRRQLGYGLIFDHMKRVLKETGSDRDGVHFHFHPIPLSKQAHHDATHWFAHSDSLYQVLSRRIIEHSWFPSCNRPGFNATSPDSHWFLEQFVPFDFSNQAFDDGDAPLDSSFDISDWRRAPRSWRPYHPNHDDHQRDGSCRRWIFRCLNIGTRYRIVGQSDVDLAFREAADGKQTVLAFAGHDFRDLRPDIDRVYAMLQSASRAFPGVKFRFSEAREACRRTLGLDPTPRSHLRLAVSGGRLTVTSEDRIFGPQPFLAIRTKSGAFHHDNLAIDEPFRSWSYMFDEQTVPPSQLSAAGVGACDPAGNAYVAVWRSDTGDVTQVIH